MPRLTNAVCPYLTNLEHRLDFLEHCHSEALEILDNSAVDTNGWRHATLIEKISIITDRLQLLEEAQRAHPPDDSNYDSEA
jgi:hypothetical protein